MELLELVDVAGEITQAGFIGKTYAVFRDGKRQVQRTWQSMLSYMQTSFHGYMMNLRQRKSESIFAARYLADHGKAIHYGWELSDFKVDTSLGDGHNVTVWTSHSSGKSRKIRWYVSYQQKVLAANKEASKYLIGADGARSAVRGLSGVEMKGNDTEYKWIRIDGLMKTNIPEPDLMFGFIETKDYGTALWLRLDNDAHRVGFALNPRLREKYPDGITEKEAIEEAVQCLKPFELSIERLDWWTYYR